MVLVPPVDEKVPVIVTLGLYVEKSNVPEVKIKLGNVTLASVNAQVDDIVPKYGI